MGLKINSFTACIKKTTSNLSSPSLFNLFIVSWTGSYEEYRGSPGTLAMQNPFHHGGPGLGMGNHIPLTGRPPPSLLYLGFGVHFGGVCACTTQVLYNPSLT